MDDDKLSTAANSETVEEDRIVEVKPEEIKPVEWNLRTLDAKVAARVGCNLQSTEHSIGRPNVFKPTNHSINYCIEMNFWRCLRMAWTGTKLRYLCSI